MLALGAVWGTLLDLALAAIEPLPEGSEDRWEDEHPITLNISRTTPGVPSSPFRFERPSLLESRMRSRLGPSSLRPGLRPRIGVRPGINSRPAPANDILVDYVLIAIGLVAGLIGLMFFLLA